ncbi:MAG: ATP-binding cassette domain-containing protein [Burkholderiales bacterium]|nr:MAG: ATP-binding cassette domain-containing protein [Burkholderiales bacterium]
MNADGFVFEALVCGYGDTMVVRGVSGCARPGQVLAVLGRNGVGKSTLLKALAGFLPLSGGRVLWRGRDLAAVPAHRRLALGIAYAPQEDVVFGELSVGDNLWLHLPDRSSERYAEPLAAFPRLRERMRQRAGSLSGGERKLLSFTRAIGLAAPLTLFDEPTEGVQAENIEHMGRLIRARRDAGASFVLVEQNLSFVESVADEVVVLDHGSCVLSGALAGLGRDRLEGFLTV